jgi:hypothetical protein
MAPWEALRGAMSQFHPVSEMPYPDRRAPRLFLAVHAASSKVRRASAACLRLGACVSGRARRHAASLWAHTSGWRVRTACRDARAVALGLCAVASGGQGLAGRGWRRVYWLQEAGNVTVN